MICINHCTSMKYHNCIQVATTILCTATQKAFAFITLYLLNECCLSPELFYLTCLGMPKSN